VLPKEVGLEEDTMKVKDLSSVEIKALIQEAVEKAMLDLLGDPDQGLKLREGIQERLKHSLERVQKGERGHNQRRKRRGMLGSSAWSTRPHRLCTVILSSYRSRRP